MRRSLALGLAIVALVGCKNRSSEADGIGAMAPPPPPAEAEHVFAKPATAPVLNKKSSALLGALGGSGGGGPGAASKGRGSSADRRPAPEDPSTIAPPEAPVAQKRMVHYEGWVRVRVTDTRKAIEDAASIATAAGGYVEYQSDNHVALRVPVARAQETFIALQKLGDVEARSLTAQDVTDAFTAAELRLKTMRASRDRLVALLASAKDEHERLRLLAEIRRLTESIDSMDLQVRTLAKLAAYSTITFEAVARQTRGSVRADGISAFRWLDELSPFSRGVAQQGKLLKLDAPKEFVKLGDTSIWSAESADGAVIWSHERVNAPQGTTDFWATAIAERLGPDFAEAKREQLGGYDFVSFIDGGDKHYRYRVGVKADGKKLEVIEIYYPTAEHETRYDAAVKAAISGSAS